MQASTDVLIFSSMSRYTTKQTICICENKDADKLFTFFCNCTARFVSDLVGYQIIGFLAHRLILLSSYIMHNIQPFEITTTTTTTTTIKTTITTTTTSTSTTASTTKTNKVEMFVCKTLCPILYACP